MALSAIQSAEHHFATVVKSAQKRSESRAEWDLPLTPMYVTGTLALNLLAHLVGAHEFSLALELPEPCLLAGNIGAGLAWGGPGMLAIASIEQWRCDECSVAENDAGVCPRCASLTNPILIGTAPLAMVSTALIGDAGVGERSVEVMESRAPVHSMCVAAGGAFASCAWAQAIVQTELQLLLAEAAFRLTVASMAIPSDCGGGGGGECAAAAVGALATTVYVLPAGQIGLIAMRRALVPAATVLLTAGVSYGTLRASDTAAAG